MKIGEDEEAVVEDPNRPFQGGDLGLVMEKVEPEPVCWVGLSRLRRLRRSGESTRKWIMCF